MELIKKRFPARTEIVSLYGIVVFVVHSWSVSEFLFHLPSFVLKFSVGEILAILSYHLTFAFFESAIVCALLLLASGILPSNWIMNGFVYKCFIVILVATIGSIILQTRFNDGMLVIDPSRPCLLYVYASLLLLLLAGLIAAVQKMQGLQRLITTTVDQISVMLFVYLPLDAISIVVVAIKLIR